MVGNDKWGSYRRGLTRTEPFIVTYFGVPNQYLGNQDGGECTAIGKKSVSSCDLRNHCFITIAREIEKFLASSQEPNYMSQCTYHTDMKGVIMYFYLEDLPMVFVNTLYK